MASYELLSALSIYGKLDLTTAISCQCSCKTATELFTETVVAEACERSVDHPLVWVAKQIGWDLTPSSLRMLKENLKFGNVGVMIKLVETDAVLYEERHPYLLDLCFDLDTLNNQHQIISTYLHTFKNKQLALDKENKYNHEPVAYSFMIEVITRLYHWGIRNYDMVTDINTLTRYPLLNDSSARLSMRNLFTVLDATFGERRDIKLKGKKLLKIFDAWNEALWQEGSRVCLGERGGVYVLKENGKKRYF